MAQFDELNIGNSDKVSGVFLQESERWRYPRFFQQESGELSADDLHHMKNVLRIKQNDLVIICSNGQDLLCRMNGDLTYKVLESRPNAAEPKVKVRLLQCVPKGGKLEFIVQKACELGAAEIVPVISKRCVSRPDDSTVEKKVIRLQKIAYEAAKQCGRGRVPTVGNFVQFDETLSMQADLKLFLYECAELTGGLKFTQIPEIKTAETIDVLIGSEGGFETYEAEKALQSGFIAVTLGKRILRADTAPICALSVLMSIACEI
jgi:16S rRNA (uracil1498-N3)-methyltransferase